MLLAIDVGNTRIKAAVFEDNTILDVVIFDKKEITKKIAFILEHHPKIKSIVVASVENLEKSDFTNFEKNASVYFISHDNMFPFENLYSTPLTLGIDRLVLATGATLQYPNQNRLVIDAGTCITYDFVNENNQYLGGRYCSGNSVAL